MAIAGLELGVAKSSRAAASDAGMLHLPAGEFSMGSNDAYPEERPVHRVMTAAFCIDQFPVTNQAFSEFVTAAGYITCAERPLSAADYPGVPVEALLPGSLVFSPKPRGHEWKGIRDWWEYVPGTSWCAPHGPGSSIRGLEDHPVVHVAHEDAAAYAAWAGKELPSETQWEYAARGGLDRSTYAWGDQLTPNGKLMANIWLGDFPLRNSSSIRGTTSPVGQYPPNGYGLYDMIGNVWEWTRDWFDPEHSVAEQSCCNSVKPEARMEARSLDPDQPQILIPRKVLKGGSFLCAPNYCQRYRPSARQPQMIDTSTSHIGFRCIRE
jgi:formylglycine-generating enzyme required for sulfatase activity